MNETTQVHPKMKLEYHEFSLSQMINHFVVTAINLDNPQYDWFVDTAKNKLILRFLVEDKQEKR